jgi:lipoate-protein ligase A
VGPTIVDRGVKEWRFIESGPAQGSWNLALDEAIFHRVRQGQSPPTVRCYSWSPPTISIGYAQDRERTVRLAACREQGIAVLRRITGGRAVLHNAEVTYSVVAGPDPELFGGELLSTYGKIAAALVEALRRLGLAEVTTTATAGLRPTRHPGCFASRARHEPAVGGRKIVGSAQRREGGFFLQQGSILISGHGAALHALLQGEGAEGAEAGEMAGLGDYLRPCPSHAEIADALRGSISAVWGVLLRPGQPTREERLLAAELERTRYRTEVWNAGRSR